MASTAEPGGAASDVLATNVAAAKATFDRLAPLAGLLGQAAAVVAASLTSGGKLLTCGNGGSAGDAMHMASEFVCRFDGDRPPFAAMCMNASGGDLTAIGNDYTFEDVFARQVQAFGRPGDVLVAFTSSGNSRNVLRAVEAARAIGVRSVAFLGKDGGFTRGVADVELLVPGTVTARVQEGQKLLLHTLCELVEPALRAAAAARGRA
ncbi:MAG TPA: SIS domain-containing protein [Tepidisphaeraceae bacterium]|nr:SIS domain-containing protein [Tepidisphaeraceae bacterium]